MKLQDLKENECAFFHSTLENCTRALMQNTQSILNSLIKKFFQMDTLPFGDTFKFVTQPHPMVASRHAHIRLIVQQPNGAFLKFASGRSYDGITFLWVNVFLVESDETSGGDKCVKTLISLFLSVGQPTII